MNKSQTPSITKVKIRKISCSCWSFVVSSGESIEKRKFQELEALCSRGGFIHAFSYLCRRDCTFGYQGGVTGDSLGHFYSPERLIRTELSILYGLMQKSGFNTAAISDEEARDWSQEAEKLLAEVHEVFKASAYQRFTKENMKLSMEDFFSQEDIIREYVFYSAEQAFDFSLLSLPEKDTVITYNTLPSTSSSFNLLSAYFYKI